MQFSLLIWKLEAKTGMKNPETLKEILFTDKNK
jgi:hypothetical protein